MTLLSGIDCGCVHKAISGPVKSRKFVKSNVNLQRQEVWPHTAISKKYAKRTTFDNLEFEAFVAGETKIIHAIVGAGDPNGMGRLRVLTLISHWMCKVKNWPVVRTLYESIIEDIELGDRDWVDDFSGHETMLPMVNISADPPHVAHAERPKKSLEVFWCKNFQSMQCDLGSPHMAQIKADEPPVPVLHICAFCCLRVGRGASIVRRNVVQKSSNGTQRGEYRTST